MKKELLSSVTGKDDLGVVIRSHIVIESYLNQLIESHMVNVDHFKKLHLKFHDLVKLAIALGLNPRFESFLNSLGTLRNDFAHNLRSSINKQDANNLYQNSNEADKKVFQTSFQKAKKTFGNEVLYIKDLKPKDKYILCVVVLGGALETACKSIIKKTYPTLQL